MRNPTAFSSYIAVSPSLDWNDQQLVDEAEVLFDRTPQLNVDLFMTTGNEGGTDLSSVERLSGVLDRKTPMDFRWELVQMPTESHQLAPHRGIHRGLEFIYFDYYLPDPMSFFEERGIQGLIEFYARTNRKIPLITYANLMNPLMVANRVDDMAMLLSQGPEAYSPSLPSVFVEGWNMLAGRYAQQDNQARAVEFYRRVLESDPANEQARNGLRELEAP